VFAYFVCLFLVAASLVAVACVAGVVSSVALSALLARALELPRLYVRPVRAYCEYPKENTPRVPRETLEYPVSTP
jgi:hypothetical protein